MTPDDLAFIKAAVARGKPVAAKRVAALMEALDAARLDIKALEAAWQDDIALLHETSRERDALRAELAQAREPQKPWYE